MEEFSSTSAFLWKAAISTAESHPLIAANLLLRCKRALNETNIGVKLQKTSKTNICQSCGNPWNRGNYGLSFTKKHKREKIIKIQKKSKLSAAKLSKFQHHMLQEFENGKSCLKICCQICRKCTKISVGLPSKTESNKSKVKSHSHEVASINMQSREAKGKSSNHLKATNRAPNKDHPVNMTKQKRVKETKNISISSAKKKAEMFKAKLKNISQNQKHKNVSALSTFLSSVK